MSPIITQPGRQAHLGAQPDAAARQRRDRLARANAEDMESALAFLSMIDPEAFEIAFTAVAPRAPGPRRCRDARGRGADPGVSRMRRLCRDLPGPWPAVAALPR